MNEIKWIQKGWECPKCGVVMAPHISCCINCRGIATNITNFMGTKANWTGEDPITKSSSTWKTAEEQWERCYLDV